MLNDKVIRTAFLISFAGHCLFLGTLGFNLHLPFEMKKSEEVTVNIEIEKPSLLPKINIMGEEKKFKEVVEKQPEPESKPQPQPEEIAREEISKQPIEEKIEVINPTQEAMLRYQDMVKQRIEEVRRYPLWAKKQGIQGIVHLNFTILSNGLSDDVEIIRSSNSQILDEEAVSAIKRANPFPSIPREIDSSFVQMAVAVVFTLK